MSTVTYSTFHTLLHISTELAPATTEAILDDAINKLNLYSNVTISNMSGVAGSKTVTLTSKQCGAVIEVAKAIYYRTYLSQLTASLGGMSGAPGNVDHPDIVAQRMARYLNAYEFKRV